MKTTKQLIGMLTIGASVAVAGATVMAPAAQAATACSVTYTVPNSWQAGFQGAITVRNTGDAWTSWTLKFSFAGGATAVQGWGGNWTTGASPTVTSASWNGSVGSGGSVDLGFIGGGSGAGSAPTSFSVNGVVCGGAATPPTTAVPTTAVPTTAGPTTPVPTTPRTNPPTTTPRTNPPTTTPRTTPPTTPPTTQPPSGNCVAPVDPQATQQAKNLLCYLYSIYGNHILSGQQESTWVSGPDYEMNYIHNATGKYPAIRASDQGDSKDWGARAVAWWNAGGIPMVSYHMGAPNQGTDGYAGSQMKGNITAAITAGTADNTRLNTRLNEWAGQLQVAQSAGAPVILRPWHEASGTWFWWSMEGASQYNKLWIYTFNYLTKTKGLHNLIWLHPYNGQPSAAWYPGKQYVDIGGADTYAGDHSAQLGLYNSAKSIYGSTMPIALHENGRIPDPALLQSQGAKWVLFNTWHSTFVSDTSINPVATFKSVYSSTYVITRDEVPNLK